MPRDVASVLRNQESTALSVCDHQRRNMDRRKDSVEIKTPPTLRDQATWGKRRTLPPRKPRLLHRTATFGTLPPRSAPVGADRRDHAVPPLIRRAPWRLLGAMRRDQRRFQDQTGR